MNGLTKSVAFLRSTITPLRSGFVEILLFIYWKSSSVRFADFPIERPIEEGLSLVLPLKEL